MTGKHQAMIEGSHPVLSCVQAMAWEKTLLAGGEPAEWRAMSRAGRALGRAVLRDAQEMGGLGDAARILVLCGKGHNGGDALIALGHLLACLPRARASVIVVPGFASLRPLVRRALEDLWRAHGSRLEWLATGKSGGQAAALAASGCFDLCLDGVFGMQFRPPLRQPAASVIEAANRNPAIRMRVAVDVPSGVGDESDRGGYRADFTYATGIAKAPLFNPENGERVGRVRYLDIGFFDDEQPEQSSTLRVLTPQVLAPLRALRPSRTDKRKFGHLFVVSGSRAMPGAVMMAVEAALLSGVGLLTAFVPDSVAAACAARLPEAMWVPMPETPAGGLALEGRTEVLARGERCSGILAGPGLGREPESLALIVELLSALEKPAVLDGDALQPELVAAGKRDALVLTPHAGEFARLTGGDLTDDETLRKAARQAGAAVALKGAPSRVCDGGPVYTAPFGGPVLSRGGSGDVLAGLAAGMLAAGALPLQAAARAVVWHGMAADRMARARAQASARVTMMADELAAVLREDLARD